ncbi:hypothetical protein [Luedemannella helvata]
MDERGEPDMATRVNGHADEHPVDGYADEDFVDDRAIDRDDLIFLVFALVAGALLALYHPPLGLITLWVFTVAAWVRRRHPVVRWALTFFAVVGLLGVLAVTVTS